MKSLRLLSVLYVLGAIVIAGLVWLSLVWPNRPTGLLEGDNPWVITFAVGGLICIVSAIECWKARERRSNLQKLLVFLPLILIGLYIAYIKIAWLFI